MSLFHLRIASDPSQSWVGRVLFSSPLPNLLRSSSCFLSSFPPFRHEFLDSLPISHPDGTPLFGFEPFKNIAQGNGYKLVDLLTRPGSEMHMTSTMPPAMCMSFLSFWVSHRQWRGNVLSATCTWIRSQFVLGTAAHSPANSVDYSSCSRVTTHVTMPWTNRCLVVVRQSAQFFPFLSSFSSASSDVIVFVLFFQMSSCSVDCEISTPKSDLWGLEVEQSHSRSVYSLVLFFTTPKLSSI